MLTRGDRVPHFEVTTLDVSSVRYADIWQRKNLVLIVLSGADSPAARQYAAHLAERLGNVDDTLCVVTGERVPGLGGTGALVADRWGEICFAREGGAVGEMPTPDELTEWVLHVRNECPECQGEAL